MRIAVVACAVLAMSFGVKSFGESLKEQKEAKEHNDSLKEGVDALNQACGTKIRATVDFKSFKPGYKDSYDAAVAVNYCKTSMDGIRYVCDGGDAEKKSVQKSVDVVNCKYDAKMTTENFPKSGVKLSGKSLSIQYTWDTANLADGVKAYLMEHLQ